MAHQLKGVDETGTRGESPSLFPEFVGQALCGFVDTALDENGRRSVYRCFNVSYFYYVINFMD